MMNRSSSTAAAGILRRVLRCRQQQQQMATKAAATTRYNSSTSLSSTTSSRCLPSASSSTTTSTPTTTKIQRCYKSTSPAVTAAYDQSVDTFPSLVIGAGRSLEPQGSFAEAQATYMEPDVTAVQELRDALIKTETGIVAHYYMDVELQGVLQAVSKELPQGQVIVADSLKMGDTSVDMARDLGVKQIICLGVDFMSESCNAILDKNGYEHVPVYRASSSKIGCSLAETAEREVYRAWLRKESADSNALHVVYINTSLETKAVSNGIVPTITCTSSNVLSTLLQASAQMGNNNLKILYGPDTYMGENLETQLSVILGNSKLWDDAKIAQDLHPQHSRASLEKLRDSIRVFPSGNCVVHHMFGQSVVDAVKRNYDDAFVTAHLEVPGEMFEIAMQKSLVDNGVVGSTSDILKFISRKVEEAAASGTTANSSDKQRLKFILGTEAGMVTSIVSSVRRILEETGNNNVEAEIVFPVADDAVMGTDDSSTVGDELAMVPGAAGGEGCSTAGGCATCPFMKMNHLDAVMDVLEMIDNNNNGQQQASQLQGHLPPDRLGGKVIHGRPAIDLGTEPIVYMRHLMQEKCLPDELVSRVLQKQ